MVDGRSWDDRSIAVDRHGDSVYKEMLEKSPFFNGLLCPSAQNPSPTEN
jgi:hypothetical protein